MQGLLEKAEDGTPEARLAAWADEAANGDGALARIVQGCLERFRRRHSCLFIDEPGPGFRAMVRVFRGAAVLFEEGFVRSTELFRISNIDRFFADPEERAATLAATSWDDRAALFAPRQPPRRTRETPPLIDWSGAACVRALPDQIRQFEYLLNADLFRNAKADVLLEQVRPSAVGGRAATIAPHRPLKAELRDSLAKILRPIVESEAAEALAAFRSKLDNARLAALAKAGVNSVSAYNWLAGLDRKVCDAQLGLRRTQAVAAYPFAWSLISAPIGPVAEAVAEARPLAPVLAKTLGVPEKAMRRVNGLGVEEAGLSEAPNPAGAAILARRATRMPPGQPPKTASGWRAFFAALDLCDVIDRIGAKTPDRKRLGEAMLTASAGRWDTLDREAVAQAAAGLTDMLQDFHANVAEPLTRLYAAPHWTMAQTLERIAGNRTLAQLAEASAWWHTHQADIRARLAALFPAAGSGQGVQAWPPLHKGGPWQATNGLVVVPLTDEAMLVEEHNRMHHCINRYAPNALYNGSHLLSIRTGTGESLGTVEIDQERILKIAKSVSEPPDAPIMQLPPAVVQFKAIRNGTPRPEAWEALWEYVSAIMTGALKIDGDFLMEDLERRRQLGRGNVRMSTCYDASTEEAVHEAWTCYSPMLPKSVIKRGPTAMVAAAPERTRRPEEAPEFGPAPGM